MIIERQKINILARRDPRKITDYVRGCKGEEHIRRYRFSDIPLMRMSICWLAINFTISSLHENANFLSCKYFTSLD